MPTLTDQDISKLHDMFKDFDMQDLSVIASLYHQYAAAAQKKTASKFKVSDAVYFKDRRSNIVEGTVTKVNRKTIKVHSKSGTIWTVSPTLLNHR